MYNLFLINNGLELHSNTFMKVVLIGCLPYLYSTDCQKGKMAEIIFINIMNKIKAKITEMSVNAKYSFHKKVLSGF